MNKWIKEILEMIKNRHKEENKHKIKEISLNWIDTKRKPKWDEFNRPVGYIIGATPGFAMIQRSPETFKDIGLMRKYMKGGLFGFEFIQLDYESISEINERYLKEMIDEAKRYQGLEIGIHAPVTDQAAVDLGIALANQWALHHRTLQRTAYSCGEIVGAKYFLFHSSNHPRPNIVYGISTEDRYYSRGQLYSFTGLSLGRWIKQVDGIIKTRFEGQDYENFVDPCYRKVYKNPENFSLKDYFMARLMNVLFEVRGYSIDPELALYFYHQETYSEGKRNAERVRDKWVNKYFSDAKTEAINRIQGFIKDIENEIKNNEQHIQSIKNSPNISEDEKKQQIASLQEAINNNRNIIQGANSLIERVKIIERINIKEGRIVEGLETLKPEAENEKLAWNIMFERGVFMWNNQRFTLDEFLKNYALTISEHLVIKKPNEMDEYEYRAIKALHILEHRGIDLEEAFEYWTEIKGSEAGEEVAYIVTAKYMYKSRDYLWIEIVGLNYENGLGEAYDPDDVILATNYGFKRMRDFYDYVSKTGARPFKHRLEKYSKAFQGFILNKEKRTPLQIAEDIVAAVASKYIQGHLFVKDEWAMDTLPEWLYKIGVFVKEDMVPFNNESIYDYAERGGSFGKPIQIFVETEQPGNDAMAGKLRLMKGKHHVILIKSIVEYAADLIKKGGSDIIQRDKGPYKDIFSYTLDFEHLSANLIDPVEDAKSLQEGDGKHIRMLHVNAPRPYRGQHGPIFLLSDEMFVLYEWMWELRKKGMRNAYFIIEMGPYGMAQSSLAFRKFAMALENDIPPDKLPAEFFGIDEALLAEQQRVLIEHAYDPLEGMLLHPEEKHTFLGNAAKEKGRIVEWSKEELK